MNNKQAEKFGAEVKAWRLEAGLTQYDAVPVLTKAAGRNVSYPLLQAIEGARREPQMWFIAAFAKVSGQPINPLLKMVGMPEIETVPAS